MSQTMEPPRAGAKPGPRVRNFSHVAIGVRDMEASLSFYRDVIGLEVAVDHMEEFIRPPDVDTRRRGVYLRWANGDHEPFVVLDEQVEPEKRKGSPKPLFEVGVH